MGGQFSIATKGHFSVAVDTPVFFIDKASTLISRCFHKTILMACRCLKCPANPAINASLSICEVIILESELIQLLQRLLPNSPEVLSVERGISDVIFARPQS